MNSILSVSDVSHYDHGFSKKIKKAFKPTVEEHSLTLDSKKEGTNINWFSDVIDSHWEYQKEQRRIINFYNS